MIRLKNCIWIYWIQYNEVGENTEETEMSFDLVQSHLLRSIKLMLRLLDYLWRSFVTYES